LIKRVDVVPFKGGYIFRTGLEVNCKGFKTFPLVFEEDNVKISRRVRPPGNF
jgi:hypothetical protein